MGRSTDRPERPDQTQTSPGLARGDAEGPRPQVPVALADTVPAPRPAGAPRPLPRDADTVTAGGLAGPAPGADVVLLEVPPGDGAVEPEALPPSINGRYKPMELLGRGGMGAVYRARDEELDRDVALKFLNASDPDLGQRLLREARAQARIEHENVCKVYEVGATGGRRYIAMQLIEGASLDHARDSMTLEEKVKVIQRVALALHEAHRLTMVHRDVKPSNIMLERGEDGAWKPYIMDFGIAREVGEVGMTMTGALAGTPAYMAPEQARGEIRALDRRTDVYSLGATLYDVLAGHPPFVEPTLWKLLQRVLHEDAPPVRTVNRQIPEDVEAILMKCLEREPHLRYDSARALSEDLGRFLDGEPVLARRRSFWYVAVRRAKKHKAVVALSAAALVTAMLFAGFWIRSRQIAEEQALLSRELGESVKEMELFLRSAYQLPLHDVEREKDIVRTRLAQIEARMAAAGPSGRGPGHYAMGRGHLALHEPREALAHLRAATAAGYASADLEYAMGLALGQLGNQALEEARHIEEPTEKKARLAVINAEYTQPALVHLQAALGARLEAPAYAEGLIALYEGKTEIAIDKAREAFAAMPWLYEARQLEGDAQLALGKRWGYDAELDHARMMEHFQKAAEAYRGASEIAASDPDVHLGECELWAQRMNAASAQEDLLESSFQKARTACDKAIRASSRGDAGHLKLAFVQGSFAWLVAATRVHVEDAEAVLKDAIAMAGEVHRRRPEDPMAAYIAGLAWRSDAYHARERGLAGRASWNRAVAAYEGALRLEPTFLWALNDLCFSYALMGESDRFQGKDPAATLERAVGYCDRAAALQPSALFARSYRFIAHFQMAERLHEVGRDPTPSLDLARQTVEAARKLSPDWSFALLLLAFTDWSRAHHELTSGNDPTASLDRAVKTTREYVDRSRSASDAHEVLGMVGVTRALFLLQRGEDPGPALREAREAFQHASDAAPWDLGYRVWRARVEIVGLRRALREGKAADGQFQAAFAPLLPLLDRERVDPRFYQALAEIHALRASWLLGERKSPAEAVSAGLEMAGKALALNPRMATALASQGALFLVQARAAKETAARSEAARQAEEALSAAVRENPTLEREQAPALAEARALRARP